MLPLREGWLLLREGWFCGRVCGCWGCAFGCCGCVCGWVRGCVCWRGCEFVRGWVCWRGCEFVRGCICGWVLWEGAAGWEFRFTEPRPLVFPDWPELLDWEEGADIEDEGRVPPLLRELPPPDPPRELLPPLV